MRSLLQMVVSTLFLTCSVGLCQPPEIPEARTCAITYRELARPAAEFIDFKTIEASIESSGLRVLREEDEEAADFSISVIVRHYPSTDGSGAFTEFVYDIYYRDTLYSVSPRLDIHGTLDAERVRLGFDFLNRNLRFVIDRYPLPEAVSIGRE